MKVSTISIQGKAYAQVKDRLHEFWKENPRGSIKTSPEFLDGTVHFTATVIKDKKDENGGDATGHALGSVGKETKDFEKLETIAVGRALALLGYASNGEIASSEEMEEFEKYKEQKAEEMVSTSREKLEECTTIDELKTIWADLPVDVKTTLSDTKEEIKNKLTKSV